MCRTYRGKSYAASPPSPAPLLNAIFFSFAKDKRGCCGRHQTNSSKPVSQFTLLASTKKGSKPDFHGALGGEEAKRLYQHFYSRVQAGYQVERVKDGVFQAMMEVALVNDGPVSSSNLSSTPGEDRAQGLAGKWIAERRADPGVVGYD